MWNGDGWWQCRELSEGTVGVIGCGLDLSDRQGNSIIVIVVESWGFPCHVPFHVLIICTGVLVLDSPSFPTLQLFMCILVAIRFEVDAVKVEKVEEVAVLIALWLGFGVEWGDVE